MAIDDVDRPGSDCTPWSGAIRSDGYGILGSSLAHRVVFAEVYGPIPVGMQIDHTCHDPETCICRAEQFRRARANQTARSAA